MNRAKLFAAVVLILIVGLVAYGLRSRQLQHMVAMVAAQPVLEYPALIELGDQDRGKPLIVRFVIANRGYGPLTVEDGGHSCACLGLLDRLDDGRFVPLRPFVLAPGESRELTTQVQVRGQTGKPNREIVRIQTNDPDAPVASIELLVNRVRGGLAAFPESVIFGTVPVGATRREVFELHDDRVPPRKVNRVQSTNPEQFSVRLLTDVPAPVRKEPGLACVARVEVELLTSQPAELFGGIEVRLAEDQRFPDVVPVVGRVAPHVEFTPSTLVLPRRSSSGDLYFADCSCRAWTGKPLNLDAERMPPGLSIKFLPVGDDASVQRFRVEWQPEGAEKEASHTIRFKVRLDDEEKMLDLPVFCRNTKDGSP